MGKHPTLGPTGQGHGLYMPPLPRAQNPSWSRAGHVLDCCYPELSLPPGSCPAGSKENRTGQEQWRNRGTNYPRKDFKVAFRNLKALGPKWVWGDTCRNPTFHHQEQRPSPTQMPLLPATPFQNDLRNPAMLQRVVELLKKSKAHDCGPQTELDIHSLRQRLPGTEPQAWEMEQTFCLPSRRPLPPAPCRVTAEVRQGLPPGQEPQGRHERIHSLLSLSGGEPGTLTIPFTDRGTG